MSEPNWPPAYIDHDGQSHAWDDPYQDDDGEVFDPGYSYREWAYDMAEAHSGGEIETWLARRGIAHRGLDRRGGEPLMMTPLGKVVGYRMPDRLVQTF
ncbi:hypothetical protein [Streptomyces sp. NPDC007088]|uniref:hypothetical protein n=1 Tax=Streptomyces sp. NPDC007088 TaxID=3364773 RepID=UPI0036A1C3A2